MIRAPMHDPSGDETKIGQLLMRQGIVDATQLAQALTIQAQDPMYRPLGKILRMLGFVTGSRLRDVLLRYRKQVLLGELLVKMGILSHHQLVRALEAQEGSTKRLGQILTEMGFVTRSHIADALCDQLGISGVDPGESLPDTELLTKVSATFLRNKKVVPLRLDEDSRLLTVLMEDPTDQETVMDLEKAFKAEVEPIMLLSGNVADVLDKPLGSVHSNRQALWGEIKQYL
jgi:type IV pilus assembly protein PilB